jgi:DNA-binding transcriptional LysR family regulator
MPISYLNEYLTLVSHMSYTSAARSLNLTQSALSKHIAALEAEFGATFIDRSAARIELTNQGRAFCEEASKMLACYEDAQRRMRSMESELHIGGSVHDAAIRYLLNATRDRLKIQGVEPSLDLTEPPDQQLAELVLCGKLDLYVQVQTGDEDLDERLEARSLTAVPLIAVVREDHPLAVLPHATLAEVAAYPVMHPTGGYALQHGAAAIEDVFGRRGLTMRRHVFFANSVADFSTVDPQDSVFVMPRSLFSKQNFAYTFKTYRSVPITDEGALFSYRLVGRRNEGRGPVRAFAEALLACARELDGVAE